MEKVALKNGVNKAVLGAKMPQTFTERVQIQEKIGQGWLVIQSGAKHITYMLWVNIFLQIFKILMGNQLSVQVNK